MPVILTCPLCQKQRSVEPNQAKKRKSDLCRSCYKPPSTKTHGMTHSRLFACWHGMKSRATNRRMKERNPCYGHVGICDDWLSFVSFMRWALANGYAAHLTIDRIENAKGYEPDNCRWVNRTTQNRNRSFTKLNLEKASEIRALRGHMLQRDIAAMYGVCYNTVYKIHRGQIWR